MTFFQHSLPRLAAIVGLLACASLAQAQYMWVDAKGIKQFSDRAPPPSVPLKDILRAPKGVPSAATMPVEPAAATAAAAAVTPALPATAATPAAKPPSTLAEREADYIKRQKDKAEKEKKASDDSAKRAAQAELCQRALAARRSIDSGVRLATTNANGERGYMDEAQRATERKQIDQALADCPAR